MVLSGSKKTTLISSITNQSQGGGSKKCGFPYQIGKTSWSNIDIHTCNPGYSSIGCCSLASTQKPGFQMYSQARPIGRNNNTAYWSFK